MKSKDNNERWWIRRTKSNCKQANNKTLCTLCSYATRSSDFGNGTYLYVFQLELGKAYAFGKFMHMYLCVWASWVMPVNKYMQPSACCRCHFFLFFLFFFFSKIKSENVYMRKSGRCTLTHWKTMDRYETFALCVSSHYYVVREVDDLIHFLF